MMASSQKIRDVSTPLDMTRHGYHTFRSSVSGHRFDCVSLFVGGPRGCIGLHRDNDAFRSSANCHSSDCACAQHPGGVHWRVPILARGSFFLETFLAICAAFHSGSVCRRIFAVVCALFIWVNSLAGLIGYFTKVRSIPSLGLVLAAAAIIGGITGSHLGSRRFAVSVISLCLATVLLIAGIKLLFTR